MKDSNAHLSTGIYRIFSVWYRHFRVYGSNIISNGLPPFLEPLIFLVGIGLGLSEYIPKMSGIPFLQYLASGLLVTSAMYTAAFECSFGTFIRLEFDKVYDGMLGAPLSVKDAMLGEMVWAGSKGFFFSFAVLAVIVPFGIITTPYSLLTPFVGLVTGLMFAGFSLFITSFIKTINHFNFYFTGFLSPMFFFSGVVFPVSNLPEVVQPISYALPLTHSVSVVRFFCIPGWESSIPLYWSVLYMVVFIVLFGFLAIKQLERRIID